MNTQNSHPTKTPTILTGISLLLLANIVVSEILSNIVPAGNTTAYHTVIVLTDIAILSTPIILILCIIAMVKAARSKNTKKYPLIITAASTLLLTLPLLITVILHIPYWSFS